MIVNYTDDIRDTFISLEFLHYYGLRGSCVEVICTRDWNIGIMVHIYISHSKGNITDIKGRKDLSKALQNFTLRPGYISFAMYSKTLTLPGRLCLTVGRSLERECIGTLGDTSCFYGRLIWGAGVVLNSPVVFAVTIFRPNRGVWLSHFSALFFGTF